MIWVGVIDSGGPAGDPAQNIGLGLRFGARGETLPAQPDRLGHGTAVASVIRRACPEAQILHAQIFSDRPVTSPAQVAAALDWFAGMPPEARPALICMSLGLAHDREVLRRSCEAITAQGIPLISSYPAQGAASYPAAYPGVIAATGDARCDWDQLSLPRAGVIGAWNNSPERGGRGMGGSSIAAARVAGHLAALTVANGGKLDDPWAALAAKAVWHGREWRQPVVTQP